MSSSHTHPYSMVAFQEAKLIGDNELLTHLKEAKGDVNYIKNGMTLLQYAYKKCHPSYKKFINAIIKAGAKQGLPPSPSNHLNIVATHLLTPTLRDQLKFSLKHETFWVSSVDGTIPPVRLNVLLNSKVIKELKMSTHCLDYYVTMVAERKLIGIEDINQLKKITKKQSPVAKHLAYVYAAHIYSSFLSIDLINIMRGNFSALEQTLLLGGEDIFKEKCIELLSTILVLNEGLRHIKNSKTFEKTPIAYRIESTDEYIPQPLAYLSSFLSTSYDGVDFLTKSVEERNMQYRTTKHLSILSNVPGIPIDEVSKYPHEKELLLPAGDTIRRKIIGKIPGKYSFKLMRKSSTPFILKEDKYNLLEYIHEMNSQQYLISSAHTITVLPTDQDYYICRINILGEDRYLCIKDPIFAANIRFYQKLKTEDKHILENILIHFILNHIKKILPQNLMNQETNETIYSTSSIFDNTTYVFYEGTITQNELTLQQHTGAIDSLYYVSENFFAEDQQFEEKDTHDSVADIDGQIVYKPNHSLAHTGRCMNYVLRIVIPILEENGYDLLQEFIKRLKRNPRLLEEILIVTAFIPVGRKGETSHAEELDKYMEYRELTKKRFLEFVEKHPQYFQGKFENLDHTARIAIYAELLVHIGNTAYSKQLGGFSNYVMIILTLAHDMDGYRCFTLELFEEGLWNRLRNCTINNNQYDLIIKIREYVKQCLVATGDRFIGRAGKGEYEGYKPIFVKCSRSPNFLLNILEQEPSPFIKSNLDPETHFPIVSHLAHKVLKEAEGRNLDLLLIRMIQYPHLYLLAKYASQDATQELFLTAHTKLGVAQQLLDKKADVTKTDYFGNTALMVAAEQGEIEIVKLLIDAKANIKAINRNKLTALNMARSSGNLTIAKLLGDSECKSTPLTTPEEKSLDSTPRKKEPKLGTSLLFIDSNNIEREKNKITTGGRSNGYWVKISGKNFFSKTDLGLMQKGLSTHNKPGALASYATQNNDIGTAYIEAIASKLYATYLAEGTPSIALSSTQNDTKDVYPIILSSEVQPYNGLQTNRDLETVCRLFEHLITNEFIGDADSTIQNFVGEKANLKRIDFQMAFQKKGEFNIHLFNPFKLIDKVGLRNYNVIQPISYHFYSTIHFHYRKCVETILNAFIKVMNNIVDPRYIELRKNTIKLFVRHLTDENIEFISGFLQDNETRFIDFLKNLKLPDNHYINKYFADKVHTLITIASMKPMLAEEDETVHQPLLMARTW